MTHHPQIFEKSHDSDDIDRLVEEIARHPERADEIKVALRARLTGDTTDRADPPKPARAEQIDLDEFWDNVPI
ncbi:MAG: hypothetical protein AAFQ79_09410 [Pseudomonadota bacterium]